MRWLKRAHPDDIEFMSEVSAATMESAHRAGHSLLILSVLFFICAGWWAHVTELDEVTKGEGKVIPSQKVQVIQNLEGGILSQVLVKEGQVVDKGEVLLRIDDTRFASSYKETELKYWQLEAKTTRLEAESQGKAPVMPADLLKEQPELAQNEMAVYKSRQQELQASLDVLKQQEAQRKQELLEKQSNIDQLKRSYDLSNQELTMSAPLVKQGVMSEVELLRLKRTVNDLKGQMDTTRLAIPRIRSALDEVRQKMDETIAKFRSDAAAQLSDSQADLVQTQATIASLKDRVTRTQVRSPVRGKVKQIKINTIGGVIKPGMDLMEIVPLDDKLLIEADIRPRDIAFLHPGQRAMIKFTAYDFSIYGGLSAKLEQISADTITNDKDESFYRIYLRTDKNYIDSSKGKLEIIPGMTATVDILTGKKTVLDYLLKPILKAKDEALRER